MAKAEKTEIVATIDLKDVINETREVAQALLDFADRLDEIDKKYSIADKEQK